MFAVLSLYVTDDDIQSPVTICTFVLPFFTNTCLYCIYVVYGFIYVGMQNCAKSAQAKKKKQNPIFNHEGEIFEKGFCWYVHTECTFEVNLLSDMAI